jgi:hypothetical protein
MQALNMTIHSIGNCDTGHFSDLEMIHMVDAPFVLENEININFSRETSNQIVKLLEKQSSSNFARCSLRSNWSSSKRAQLCDDLKCFARVKPCRNSISCSLRRGFLMSASLGQFTRKYKGPSPDVNIHDLISSRKYAMTMIVQKWSEKPSLTDSQDRPLSGLTSINHLSNRVNFKNIAKTNYSGCPPLFRPIWPDVRSVQMETTIVHMQD